MNANFKLNRRTLVLSTLSASIFPLTACTERKTLRSGSLDFDNLSLEEAFRLYIKSIGSLTDTRLYIWFKGVLWGVIPGQLPQAFCGFQGLARHDWKPLADNAFSQTEYDVGFFSDLETGLPISQLVNPFTGETVSTFHYKYGGFHTIHSAEKFEATWRSKNLEWRTAGPAVTLTDRATGQIKSKFPPETWPRESSGPINFYGGETSYAMSLSDLSDTKIDAAPYTMFWTSFAPWEPWLMMDGAKGVCQWRATGSKLTSYEEAPREMLDFIAAEQPNYFDAAPPWDGILSNTDRYIKSREK